MKYKMKNKKKKSFTLFYYIARDKFSWMKITKGKHEKEEELWQSLWHKV